MSAVDNLPGDQRAVLQLVLGRGRSYDEIARLLSINPESVRERAMSALDALGPQTKVSAENRDAIGNYLLGQLPADQIGRVRELLAHSPSERAWARVLSSEIAPLASGPLPDIPVDGGTPRSAPTPTPAPVPAPPLPGASATPPSEPGGPTDSPAFAGPAGDPPAADAAGPAIPSGPSGPSGPAGSSEPDRPAKPKRERRSLLARRAPASGLTGPSADGPRSSRLGGMIVIALAVVVVIVVVIVLIGPGGSSPKPTTAASVTKTSAPAPAASTTASTTPSTTASSTTSAGSTTSGTTTAGSTSAKPIAQINLTPPAGSSSKATGIAEVLREGSSYGIAIVGANIPPNASYPPNAYAVWLYNTPTDAAILGFVNPGVGSNGRLSTAGPLPANAAHYKYVVVTIETTAKPKVPGTAILTGALTGL